MKINYAAWDNLQDCLGFDMMAILICGSGAIARLRSYLFEYDEDPNRFALEEVKARFNFVVKITNALAGSYNDAGIRRWFFRERAQLQGSSPLDVLSGNWKPEEEGPQKVLALAKELAGPQNAT